VHKTTSDLRCAASRSLELAAETQVNISKSKFLLLHINIFLETEWQRSYRQINLKEKDNMSNANLL
jgi:hypothetical protein